MLELEFDSPVLDSRATVLSQLYRRKAESLSMETKCDLYVINPGAIVIFVDTKFS